MTVHWYDVVIMRTADREQEGEEKKKSGRGLTLKRRLYFLNVCTIYLIQIG